MRVRKSAEARRSEIVEAALQLADRVGPARLTTEAVAKSIHVTQATVFHHFSTKQDLWVAVVGEIRSNVGERWKKIDNTAVTASDKLQVLIVSQLDLIQSTPAIPSILLSRELLAESEDLRDLSRSLVEEFHELVAGLIEEGQRSDCFKKTLNSRDAACLVVGLVQGLVQRWLLSGRDFNLAGEGQRLLLVLLAGLGSPSKWHEVFHEVDRRPSVNPSVESEKAQRRDV